MPTLINPARTVKRETASTYRGIPLIVELHPGYLTLRQKGRRRSVSIEYGAVLDLGYKILARAERAEKLASKAEKRKPR
jgi:hypothetical protein